MERVPLSVKTTTADALFNDMLARIESGEWKIGSSIPSERRLMEEYGVSRITIRDALSRMRALGLMRIAHGKKTIIEKMDVRILGRIFPVLLALEGERNFLHFLQLRITLETQAAFSAALNRTDEDLSVLADLLAKTQEDRDSDNATDIIVRDYDFHIGIARACKNPLFPMLIEALSGYLAPLQASSYRRSQDDRELLNAYHVAIFEAIRDGLPEMARRHMENHLRASVGQIVCDGIWQRQAEKHRTTGRIMQKQG